MEEKIEKLLQKVNYMETSMSAKQDDILKRLQALENQEHVS